jgi:alpha-L-arabinofuranosidase
MNSQPVTGAEGQNGLFASAVLDKNTNEIIVKVINTSDKTQALTLNFTGLQKNQALTGGKCIQLQSSDPDKDNTLEQPSAVIPQETMVKIEGNLLKTELGAKTFAIYKISIS